MELQYNLKTYGINEDVAIGLTVLQGDVRRVDIVDEYSYIAIFLDRPEANHVFCVGIAGGGTCVNYFERVYLEAVIGMAWRHGLPFRVFRHIPQDELAKYQSQVKYQD